MPSELGFFQSFFELSFNEVLSPTKSNINIIVVHFVSRKFEICPNKGTYSFYGVTHERLEKEEGLQLLKIEREAEGRKIIIIIMVEIRII